MRLSLSCSFVIMTITLSMADAGMVANWTMDDNAADNVVTDSVGGYNGALYQTDLSWDNPISTANRSIAGAFGTALDLQDQVWADLTAHVANLRPAGDYTLAMWVKNVGDVISTQQYGHPLFSWSISDPYHPRFQFITGYADGSYGRLSSFYASAESGAGYLATSAQLTTWETEQWHHVAMTVENIDGTKWLRFYHDGIKVNEVKGMWKLFGTGDDVIDIPTPGMYPEWGVAMIWITGSRASRIHNGQIHQPRRRPPFCRP